MCEFPSGLISAAEAAGKLAIEEARLVQFAEDGYAPHWRIDSGPPMFRLKDVREWCARNLIAECRGTNLPRNPVNILIEPDKVEWQSTPKPLRDIENLRDVSHLVRQACTGIYFLCYAGQIVYIGQSVAIVSRIQDHAKHKQFDQVFLLPWPRCDLDRLEGTLIRHFKPPLNGNPGPRPVGDDEDIKRLIQQVLGPQAGAESVVQSL